MGSYRRKGYMRGEKHVHVKHTDAVVAEVRRAYEAGEGSQRALGVRYGISQFTVRDWVTYATRY